MKSIISGKDYFKMGRASTFGDFKQLMFSTPYLTEDVRGSVTGLTGLVRVRGSVILTVDTPEPAWVRLHTTLRGQSQVCSSWLPRRDSVTNKTDIGARERKRGIERRMNHKNVLI